MHCNPFPLLIAVFSVCPVLSQDGEERFSCKTYDPLLMEQLFRGNEEGYAQAVAAKSALDEHTRSFVRDRGAGSFVVPVVFHVIHQYGPENISDAQMYDAIRVLNEDYNKLNPDWSTARPEFLDIVADVGITFRLSQRDPEGGCTNGITRTVSPLTYEGNFAMKQLIQWPRDRYLNVWVSSAANGAAGYSNYPWVVDGSPETDGIVIKASYVGSFGTSNAERSRVLSHEVGHWLNLLHCWGNSNDPELSENCDMDDGVEDTPLTRGWTSCSLNGSSCGSTLDNVENYMEYASCRKMFTNGQADRMIAALTSSTAQRDQLWQPENLVLTGVNEEPSLCSARFTKSRGQICAGGSVTFTDASFNTVSQRTWEFPGGEPSTSNEVTPTVVYPTSGNYGASLTVTDGTTTLTTSETFSVEVLSDPGASVPLVEGFEFITELSSSPWTVVDPDENNGFELTAIASASGDHCVRVSNGPGSVGHIDDLISTTYDLSNMEGITLSFRHAYAQREETNDDELRVFVSNNCGLTWSLRKQMFGSTTLNTAGVVDGVFIPDQEEWQETVVSNFGPNEQASGFRIKFQFVGAGGNAFYLDDINLNGLQVGFPEMNNTENALIVRPNPASNYAEVIVNSTSAGKMRITLLDVLGRPVANTWSILSSEEVKTVHLPLDGLSSGVYFVHADMAGIDRVVRLVVDEAP